MKSLISNTPFRIDYYGTTSDLELECGKRFLSYMPNQVKFFVFQEIRSTKFLEMFLCFFRDADFRRRCECTYLWSNAVSTTLLLYCRVCRCRSGPFRVLRDRFGHLRVTILPFFNKTRRISTQLAAAVTAVAVSSYKLLMSERCRSLRKFSCTDHIYILMMSWSGKISFLHGVLFTLSPPLVHA